MKWVWQMASLSQLGSFLIGWATLGISEGAVIATLVFAIIFALLAAYCEEKEEE